jgi:hypothetical protein
MTLKNIGAHMDFSRITQNSLRLSELETGPIIAGKPPQRAGTTSSTRGHGIMVAVCVGAGLVVLTGFGWGTTAYHYATELHDMTIAKEAAEKKAVDNALRATTESAAKKDISLIANEALSRLEQQKPQAANLAKTTKGSSVFVYVGACGDGWTQDNFDGLPPCKNGDIMVRQIARTITARHNLTLRSAVPVRGTLGPQLDTMLLATQKVHLVDLKAMSSISEPPRLYWAEITMIP